MLARRFAIVCLLTALFGMSFSILAVEYSRSSNRADNSSISCTWRNDYACRWDQS